MAETGLGLALVSMSENGNHNAHHRDSWRILAIGALES